MGSIGSAAKIKTTVQYVRAVMLLIIGLSSACIAADITTFDQPASTEVETSEERYATALGAGIGRRRP
jgi:hypothetical protein